MAKGTKAKIGFVNFINSLVRRKQIKEDGINETKFERCLSTLDLTALGIGSTLGAGIYVVAGEVAKDSAGPSVILSFLIAAAASVLAGLCYAEFGARVPKTGSAYVYSYVSVGELMAFVIGWNLILEYVIGTASVARAWTANFDKLVSGYILTFFETNMPMSIPGFAAYPDFFAFGITMLLTIILAVGVKESSTFNKIFTFVNLCIVSYVIICGFFNIDIENWKIDPEAWSNYTEGNITATEENLGQGGFFPFGVAGMLSGAGTCFYAFVGFDTIATTAEEVKNPQKAIPISIVLCLAACFVAYLGISATITLTCPYFLLDAKAPLPFIFNRVGWTVAKYVVSVGAVCGLSTSLMGAMFPLPRVIYAMADDGLIFRFLAKVHHRFRTPLIATVVSGLLSASMALLFELKALVDMMSIGTLLAYTLVAVSVLILRGKRDCEFMSVSDTPNGSFVKPPNSVPLVDCLKTLKRKDEEKTLSNYLKYSFVPHSEDPTVLSEYISTGNTYLLFSCLCCFCFTLTCDLTNPGIIFGCVAFGIISALFTISLHIQPENKKNISFKVPFVPWLPTISIVVNIYLMMMLSMGTWVRFSIWMMIGFVIYFGYGFWHSSERTGVKDAVEMEVVYEGVAVEDTDVTFETDFEAKPTEDLLLPNGGAHA